MNAIVEDYADIRGSVTHDAPLAPYTWFRVGGKADTLFRPKDEADLRNFLRQTPPETPVTVIGAASNTLIRDGGVEGVVVKLGKGFGDITPLDENTLRVGAALPDLNLARYLADNALDGGAFFRGVPGTVGGAIRMNAGAYGTETRDVITKIYGVDRSGDKVVFSAEEADFAYRRCGLPSDIIFTAAEMRFKPGDATMIRAEMVKITEEREKTQPVKSLTGGSTFKNPPDAKAWMLIDAAGCRGLQVRQARMSEKHCNFMINEGGATARDLEKLGETVRQRVFAHSGVLLEWEIKRIGRFGAESVTPFTPDRQPSPDVG